MLNYTSKIDCFKTISEIQQILSKAGARKCIIDTDTFGNPSALTFTIDWNGNMVAFSLPCNFDGVLKAMKKDKKISKSFCTEDQAMRTGWRILKDWISAQLALIESEQASLAEVFLPYAVTKSGDTLFKYMESNNQLLLN